MDMLALAVNAAGLDILSRLAECHDGAKNLLCTVSPFVYARSQQCQNAKEGLRGDVTRIL